MIRVVIVDDSALARKLLSEMLGSDPSIDVVGTAMNGIFGLRRVYRDRPDVVVMDFEMPQMDGLQTLEAIMRQRPTPVVMVSSRVSAADELTPLASGTFERMRIRRPLSPMPPSWRAATSTTPNTYAAHAREA